MSYSANTGGPAFPNAGNSNWNLIPDAGMSLRDWFAGRAMQALAGDMAGVIAVADEHGVNPTVLMARLAYGAADAMLAARDVPAKEGASSKAEDSHG